MIVADSKLKARELRSSESSGDFRLSIRALFELFMSLPFVSIWLVGMRTGSLNKGPGPISASRDYQKKEVKPSFSLPR